MPVALEVDAFTAFQDQLRTLCLKEFPCGTGTWRTSTDKNIPGTRFAVTLKDYDALKEQEETLEELVTSKFSPYSVDYSWSDESKGLRELAVKSPWVITEDFIHKHFKTLRIIDKNVTQLDPDLLKLINLEELTLSANQLKTVQSQNIPKSVKVLELVANEIEDLKQLCKNPPELQHLGLGLNKISSIHDYMTGAYWPVLLSLDLSHNNLCDLIQIVNTLSSLTKLRNLVLLGNPLALIPGYRGFTVDSLRKLDILDDLQISADEKHHFKGLARRKEYVLDESKVTVNISAAGGISKPQEMLDNQQEEVPQYPITTRTYYVEFMFLEDFQAKSKPESAILKMPVEKGGETKDADQEKDVVAKEEETKASGGEGDKKDKPDAAPGTESDNAFFTQADTSSPRTSDPEADPAHTPSHTPPPTLKLVPYRTQGLVWTEEGFKFDFSQEMVIDDLPALKEFFKRGIPLSIKEDKVFSTPVEPEEGSEDYKKKDKSDKKKKKKEPEVELLHSTPEVRLLGTYMLDLSDFIEGEYVIQSVCKCKKEGQEATEEKETPKAEEEDGTDSKKDKKKKKEEGETSAKGKKGKGDGKESKLDKDKDKGKKQPLKPDKKDSKAAKRPGSGKSQPGDEDEKPLPPPLTITISVELHHWKTAQDSIAKPTGTGTGNTVAEKLALLEIGE